MNDAEPEGAKGANGMARVSRRREALRCRRVGTLADGARSSTPAQWLERLEGLLDVRPPSNVAPSLWRARVRGGLIFARDWGRLAHAVGWSADELFALHPSAPLIRFDAMGAAFLASGGTVLSVTDGAIVFVREGGAAQKVAPFTTGYPPAWQTFPCPGFLEQSET